MKRILSVLCALALVVCCFAGCQNESTDNQFIVGFDNAFPPMGFVNDQGENVGFDLDLAAKVAEKLDMELVLRPIAWNAKDMELESGSISCIWNGFTMEGREDDYTFTEPYMNNNQIVVVRADSTYQTFADLSGKNAAVQDESSALNALESNTALKESFSEIVKTADNLGALNELNAGAVEAVVMDECVARYNIEKQGGQYRILDEVVGKERFAVGFKKGNTELRDKVQNALNELAQEGVVAEISEYWFGEDLTIIGK